MRSGRLDRRITIQRSTSTPSDSGEPELEWGDLAAVWAWMAPVRGSERFTNPQLVAEEQIEFRIRYSATVADLTPLDRIIYPSLSGSLPTKRVHDILAVHEIGRREGLQIITQRRPDVLTFEDIPGIFDFSRSSNSALIVLLEDI